MSRNVAAHFLMCPPRFYGVEYVINPWMEGNVGRARHDVAAQQWEALYQALAAHARIERVEPAAGLPDMPFTANAGLVFDDLFVPARFRFPQRQPEVRHFTEWFGAQGYRIAELPAGGSFEGEGDALFQPDAALLWGGYGVRTSLEVYGPLAEILGVEVIPLRLVDERFYHLDTCFCPLPNGRIIYYSNAFDTESVAAITARVAPEQRFDVSSSDALHFACNAVTVGTTFITTYASDDLRARLTAWGYEVEVRPLTEFILAGGAAKCLVLRLAQTVGSRPAAPPAPVSGLRERLIDLHGHLLDRGLMNRALDCITDAGGSFELEAFQPGLRHDQRSWSRVRVVAPTAVRLDAILDRLMQLGAHVVDDDADARLEAVTTAGVAPQDFYSTTIFPTDVRVRGHWVRATGQRMDAALVVDDMSTLPLWDDGEKAQPSTPEAQRGVSRDHVGSGGADAHGAEPPRVRCCLLRDLQLGDPVVCGLPGVRIHPVHTAAAREPFAFMRAPASSERRVELAVERIAWEMRRIRERERRIVVVAGPVVIHTGGGPHLASLVRRGYVQALLGGNGLAAHDIESALFGTSLGVDLQHGTAVPGGHQHHLRAINLMRACGGIAAAVQQGVLRSGVMYECVRHGIPFALAGSIRDDGPLPETLMDLIAAQSVYAKLIEDAAMILMLSSMLHSIGVGNMTPAGVRLICVDISPATVTKLADRGSLESVGLVTDVGLFLNLLDSALTNTDGH